MVEPDAFIDSSLENFRNRTGTSYSTNPTVNRLLNSGLIAGGGPLNSATDITNVSVQFQDNMQSGYSTDWKVRISVDGTLSGMFAQGVMSPLASTNGVIFPYTPEISITHQVNYSQQRYTHSNYAHLSYENSEISTIQIIADFTAQSRSEAAYVLACIYFFRTATKMIFGQDAGGASAGNPPPLVKLNGYGRHIFKDLPCVITQFTHTLPNDVDYLETASAADEESDGFGISSSQSNGTRIPTVTRLTVTLQPVYSKRGLAGFNLADFARGALVDRGYI